MLQVFLSHLDLVSKRLRLNLKKQLSKSLPIYKFLQVLQKPLLACYYWFQQEQCQRYILLAPHLNLNRYPWLRMLYMMLYHLRLLEMLSRNRSLKQLSMANFNIPPNIKDGYYKSMSYQINVLLTTH